MQPTDRRLDFNLGHSEDRATLAVSSGLELGIDIERVCRIEEERLPSIYSETVRHQFSAMRPAEREATFFRNWVRKEACLKAMGAGLLVSPTHFEFDLQDATDGGPLRVGGRQKEAEPWQICSLQTDGP